MIIKLENKTLSIDEYAYIQSYAFRYLKETYMK